MNIWLLLLIAFITQESFLTTLAVIQARKVGIDWSIITFIFAFCTLIDLFVPYYLTKKFLHKTENTRVGKILKKWCTNAEKIIHKRGLVVGYIIIGIFWYIQMAAMIVALLKSDVKKSFTILFFSNCIWYIGIVISAVGVQTIMSDSRTSYISVILWIIVLILIIGAIFKRWVRI